MGDTEASGARLYRWMTENYDAIRGRIPPEIAGFMPYFASGCERTRLEAAQTFFAAPGHDSPGGSSTLAKVADQVTDCAGLRDREGPAVTTYLIQLVGTR